MDEEEIAAHAEARANLLCDDPRASDFDAAENDIRQFLAEGARYDDELGWVWPADEKVST